MIDADLEADLTWEIPDFVMPTELELIKIFPECREIIPEKIKEWVEIRDKILAAEVAPILRKIAALKDEFSRWFWKEAVKICLLPVPYRQAEANLKRLARLKLLASDEKYNSAAQDLERRRILAKQTPILSLYSFKKLRRVGSRQTALCPFHNDKTPSFMIYPDNTFHCFGCGAAGDAIDFVKQLKGCSFADAVTQMAGG